MGGQYVTVAAKVGNVGWHPYERAVGMWSSTENASAIIVMTTLTSSSMFLLLATGGSRMCFYFVLAYAGSVGCCINMEVMKGWQGLLARGGMWRLFCMVGST